MRESLYNSTVARSTLLPAAYTANTNGTTVDRHAPALSNFRAAMLIVHVGAVTDGTHAVALEVSDNGSDWAAPAAEHLQGPAISVTSSNDEAVFEVGYTGPARYLRAVATVDDEPETGGIYGATIVLSEARRTPVPRP